MSSAGSGRQIRRGLTALVLLAGDRVLDHWAGGMGDRLGPGGWIALTVAVVVITGLRLLRGARDQPGPNTQRGLVAALLAVAVVSAVVALVAPGAAGVWSVGVAVTAVGIAAGLPGPGERAVAILGGAAGVGVGSYGLSLGSTALAAGTHGDAPLAVGALCSGVVLIVGGVAILLDHRALLAAALVGAGALAAAGGIALALATGSAVFAAPVVLMGLAWVGAGVAFVRDSRAGRCVAAIGLGVGLTWIGIASTLYAVSVTGLTLVLLGALITAVGVGSRVREPVLVAALALLAEGLAGIALGVVISLRVVATGELLADLAMIAGCCACLAVGVAKARESPVVQDLPRRLRARWVS